MSSSRNANWLNQKFVMSLVNSIPAHIFWKDKNGVYIGCNTIFANSLGFTAEDIIGKTDYDLPVNKSDSDKYRKDDIAVMESKEPKLNMEEEQTLSDGRKIYLLTSKVPLFNEDKEVTGILGIYSDITELKQAKEKAEASVNAKNEFLKNMRHDFRTPFSGLYGMTEYLWTTEPDPKRKEHLKLVFESAKILLDYHNEIFDFIQNENGPPPVLEEKFNLHTLIKNVIKMHLPPAETKNLEVKYSIAENVPRFVLGDELRTKGILVNLLSNAIKFTDCGSIEFSAEAKSTSEFKTLIKFKIKDTGIGMAEDRINGIFEKFSRLTPSYASSYKGRGLGLNIVKQYITELEGEACVTSELHKGSEFTLFIPYKISKNTNSI